MINDDVRLIKIRKKYEYPDPDRTRTVYNWIEAVLMSRVRKGAVSVHQLVELCEQADKVDPTFLKYSKETRFWTVRYICDRAVQRESLVKQRDMHHRVQYQLRSAVQV